MLTDRPNFRLTDRRRPIAIKQMTLPASSRFDLHLMVCHDNFFDKLSILAVLLCSSLFCIDHMCLYIIGYILIKKQEAYRPESSAQIIVTYTL